jgi:hypothetical protein
VSQLIYLNLPRYFEEPSMRPATAAVTAQHERSMTDSRFQMESGQEEALLRLDLSDLVLPKMDNLQVDGLRSSWLSRLLGRK